MAIASYAQDFEVDQLNQRASDSAHVSGIGSHHRQIVVVNNLLHLLYTSEVSQHISNRDDVTILDQAVGDLLGAFYRTGPNRLTSAMSRSLDLPSRQSKLF